MTAKREIRVCECGCGKSFPRNYRGRIRRFATTACRKRGNRKERGDTPSPVTYCACGCGELAIGPRKLYASPACKQRAYRKRKDFDELGPDYDWSERPETPRKADKTGLKIKLWIEP